MSKKKIFQPDYYKQMTVEPIRVIRSVLTPEQLEGFYKGNMIKYLLRAPHKGHYEEDMDKMTTYASWLKDLKKEVAK
jgi:hypothetical protein